MSYAPGAPPQVWAITSDVLDAAAKWTYAYCWSKADHEIQQNPRPTTIWLPRRLHPEGHAKAGQVMPAAAARDIAIAEATGTTPGAVRKHFTKIRAAGLGEASGRCVYLTPEGLAAPLQGQTLPDTVNPNGDQPDPGRDGTDPSGDEPDPTGSLHLNPPVPPTPPSPAVEARDPLPQPAQTASQASAQAQLERERAVVRARFSGPPSDVLTAVMLEAVNPEHRDAWVQEAAGGEYGSWSTAMGERARKLGLTRDALGAAVLASWERECAVFPRGIKPGQPDRGELWYGKHSTWLRKAAGLGESTTAETPRAGQFAMSGALRRVL